MRYLNETGLNRLWERTRALVSAKQDILTGASGQIVGFNGAGEAVAQTGWRNPNLLDNWYLVDPVNQRGQKAYAAPGYAIDRWYIDDAKITVGTSGLCIENCHPDDSRGIFQRLEHDIRSTCVFSVLTTGGNGLIFAENVYKTTKITGSGVFSIIFEGLNASINNLFIRADPLQSIQVVAAKLESGSVQTLAEQNAEGEWILRDPPPDGTQELLKCQRYYQVFSSPGQRPEKAADFRPVMRINPVLGTITRDGETYYTADANL